MMTKVWGMVVLTLAAAGCSSEKPAAHPQQAGITTTTTNAAATPHPASQGVAISDDIAKACRIDVNNVQTAPKFDFDQSALPGDDRDVLNQVAKCLTTGPLKGRAVKLVGRADSRGEPEYNLGLGEHRADSVRSYLTQLGVENRRIAETSRGELDATGHDEASWRLDRRVDVLLQ